MPISTVNQKGLDAPLTLTSPVLTTPNLGTPSAINLSNATALPKAALPAGTVLQVVSGTGFGGVTIGGTAASVLSASITPTSTSSKILISTGTVAHRDGGGNIGWYWSAGIYRTNISTVLFSIGDAILYQSVGDGQRVFCGGEYLDSPATTSSVTYGIRAERMSGSGTATFNQGGTGYITLMEVAG